MVKEGILFLHCAQCFTYPAPLSILFPSSSLSTIFIIFPPPPQFYCFPSSTSTSSFILYIFPSTNTSTSYRPYNHPTSTLLSTFFNTASWIVKLYTTTTTTFLLFSLHHHHTITTATTFLLFSLHRHNHHFHCHHISIVFPPPGGGGGKTIRSRESGVDYLRQLWQVHTVLSDFLRKLLLQWN